MQPNDLLLVNTEKTIGELIPQIFFGCERKSIYIPNRLDAVRLNSILGKDLAVVGRFNRLK
jgi:hypothetical protein